MHEHIDHLIHAFADAVDSRVRRWRLRHRRSTFVPSDVHVRGAF